MLSPRRSKEGGRSMASSIVLSLWLSLLTYLFNLLIPVRACLELTENGRPALFCQTSVSQLPLNSESIPAQLANVRILGTSSTGQHDGRLSQVNLTGLETLTYLEISNFNLEVIQADAFRTLRQLRVLDLSRNRITTIHPGAFTGLKLDLLSLTDNAGLTLVRGVFRGAEVTNLAARNCGLREVDYDTISEAKPKQLGLSHNQITTLDLRFEKLIKPWTTSSQTPVTDMEEWGVIDLTNNPLNCNCQLIWIPKVIEEQLYAAQRQFPKHGYERIKEQFKVHAISDTSNGLPTKRMYQLNLTCANPPRLAGKPLPQSWNFFCPRPTIVGIVVSLLTSQADHAQLTCIGKGQPPPRLAWTYRLNGHKVQKTLESPTTENLQDDDYRFRSPFDDHEPKNNRQFDKNLLVARSIALNVSLREPNAKNFTCTVWNDDSLKSSNENHPFGMIDRLKSSGLDMQNQESLDGIQNYRMNEVTVRIYGPPLRPSTESFIEPKISREQDTKANQSALGPLIAATETLLSMENSGPYDYLFTERFSLLQLLGAIFGTFIVTLALLYATTHFLSCFCHFPPFPMKEAPGKRTNEKITKKRRFSLLHPRDMVLFSSSQSTPERTPLNDVNLGNTFHCDSAFSLLTSGTNNFNLPQGPSTVSIRKQTLPQALLLTSVPAPPGGRDSTTPPPNPAYWSMPEYTYTGTGSHEYDVPRPLEPLISSQSLVRTGYADTHNPTSGTTQPFISLANQTIMPGISNAPFPDLRYNRNPLAFQSGLTMPSITNQWPQQINHEISALNALFTWGQIGNHTTNMLERQLPCVSYAQYPSSTSAVYAADYPAYLQTRPYPHHQNKVQPLLQLMTQSNQLRGDRTMNNGNETEYPTTQSQESIKLNGGQPVGNDLASLTQSSL